MNLLCPNCQKMIQVSDQYAGQEGYDQYGGQYGPQQQYGPGGYGYEEEFDPMNDPRRR